MNKETTNRPILIADSGATKSDWILAAGGKILRRFTGKGITPVYQSQAEIADAIRVHILPQFQDVDLRAVYFYGSGCIPEKTTSVRDAIARSFRVETIEVYSDLIGVARALCGHRPGIACILGTGSNSCQWDGEHVVKQVPPLGFILGDEGSGATLGKLLVADALKNRLPTQLKEELLDQYGLTQANVIDRVYRGDYPSRFLASLAPFLLKHIRQPAIRRIVVTNFSDFFERNVMQYNYKENRVNFVGSIARYFADVLHETAAAKGIGIGKIEQSPINGLVEYYNA